jgi:hypothetical protein
MNCPQEVNLTDKIVAYIKQKIPDYEYQYGDFGIYEDKGPGNGIQFRPWPFEFKEPNYKDLENVTVEKRCEKYCLGCMLRRLEALEKK